MLDLKSLPSTMLCILLWVSISGAAWGDEPDQESNLLSLGEGTIILHAPASYADFGNWSPMSLIDELPSTGWATKDGDLTPKVFVFQLANRSSITSLAFNTASVENRGRGAKDVLVEISDRSDAGFSEIAKPSLEAMKDGQKFVLKAPAQGRYLRLTVLNNWGDSKFMELMDFSASGKALSKVALADHTGTYASTYGNFRVQQTQATAEGCYEHAFGLIENGGFDGRVMRFTWIEGEKGDRKGPAILVFPDDGQSFVGYWWNESSASGPPAGEWLGKRVSKEVGSCPHWKPAGASSTLVDEIKNQGRVRLYGILFDTDSDALKPESKPALDALISAARSQPAWNLMIEGHTDSTGGDGHNQPLSEKRAAAVKAYLVNAGIDKARLSTRGFGSSQPVSSNDTTLGRSENRRVEIVKQ